MNNINVILLKLIEDSEIGSIEFNKNFKNLYVFLPEQYRHFDLSNEIDKEKNKKYKCSKVIGIKKYGDNEISLTFVNVTRKFDKQIDPDNIYIQWHHICVDLDFFKTQYFSETFIKNIK